MATLLTDIGLVVSEGFSQITNVFTLIIDTPILLIPVGFTVFGIVMKFGKKMLRL